ncbi:MAG: TonB-dependent receptor, partial [Sphingobium sp.]
MKKISFENTLTAAVIALTPVSAHAQGSAGANEAADIIVTARRTEERLQDVPISITVFNQQQIANRNIVNAQDLAAYTPSLSANSNFGSDNSSFALRGFVQDTGTAPSVGVYFADVVALRGGANGIPSGDGAGPGAFFDLQNVQVLKGPQGTLFGRNTTGGAILLVPQKPTGHFEGYVEGSIGNYDMRRIQTVVNIPVLDSLRIRFGVDRQTRDGYLNNVSGVGPKDYNDIDYTAVRASIVADLTPNLENYTIINYSTSSNNGVVQKLIAAANSGIGAYAAEQLTRQGSGFYNVMQNLPYSYSDTEQWQIINTTTWRATDALTVKNITSYGQLKQRIFAPLFGTDFLLNFGQISPALAGLGSARFTFATLTVAPGRDTVNQSTLTEELQLQGRALDERLDWQAGAYYELSQPVSTNIGGLSQTLAACTDLNRIQCNDPLGFLATLSPLNPPGNLVSVGSVKLEAGQNRFRNAGLYTQASYRLSEKLKLTAGLRYTWDSSSNVSEQRTYTLAYPPGLGPMPTNPVTLPVNPRCTNPAATATDCISRFYQSSSKPTWLLGLDYTPIDNLLLYAKYVRGFRAGTIAPTITAPLNIVKPEQVDSYEAGLKASFSGAVKGTFNAAAFYNDFSNQQLQLGFTARPNTGLGSAAAPVNAGKSELWGFEAEGSINPIAGLSITGGYTYLRTRIKSVPDFSTFNDPNYVLSTAFQVGDPVVLTPRNKYSVTATYTLPLDEAIGRVSVGATFTHRDSLLTNYTDRTST